MSFLDDEKNLNEQKDESNVINEKSQEDNEQNQEVNHSNEKVNRMEESNDKEEGMEEKDFSIIDESVESDREKDTVNNEKDLSYNKERSKGELVKSTLVNKGHFFSGFIGVIVGALICYLVLGSFSHSNEANVGQSGSNQTLGANQVSYEVVTDNQAALDKALETVVGITNYQTVNSFWGSNESLTQEAGSGSGVIYKIDNNLAYIVTNYHVINGATSLDVTLSNGVKKEAKVVGSDVWTDLAVITIEAEKEMKVIEFGNSSTLKIGEPVIAIGNPLGLDFYGSVTQGIISGLNRAVGVDVNSDGINDWNADVLQTDAAINPGNSGGALINMKGQLIGINSMKIATSSVEGIGFAIPVNEVNDVMKDLEQYGKVRRPYMGVSLLNVSDVSAYHQANTLKLPREVTTGVVLDTVEENSPAAKAGLQRFDVIVELDGQEVSDVVGLRKHLYTEKEIGQELKVKYYHNGELKETTMVLTTSMD